MNEIGALQTTQANSPLTELKHQIELIHKVMTDIMQKDEHYGIIPGCKKPSLFKAGAEKLCATFRLVTDIKQETIIDLGGGHREYRYQLSLYGPNGNLLGVGVGSASTMEGKYRFRNADPVNTGNPVPKEYWDGGRDISLIGGKGHIAKKADDGKYYIHKVEGKVEHDNPADFWNTVQKMAYKRALISVTLMVTSASDIFTQDVEDMPEVIPPAPAQAEEKPKSAPKSKPPVKDAPEITVAQINEAFAMLGIKDAATKLAECKSIAGRDSIREAKDLLPNEREKVLSEINRRIDEKVAK